MTKRVQAGILAPVLAPSTTADVFYVREASLQPFRGFGAYLDQPSDGSSDDSKYFVLMIRHQEPLPPLLLPASEIECGAALTASTSLTFSPSRSFIEAAATVALLSDYKRVDISAGNQV